MIFFILVVFGLMLFTIVMLFFTIPADVGRQMEYALSDIGIDFKDNEEEDVNHD